MSRKRNGARARPTSANVGTANIRKGLQGKFYLEWLDEGHYPPVGLGPQINEVRQRRRS